MEEALTIERVGLVIFSSQFESLPTLMWSERLPDELMTVAVAGHWYQHTFFLCIRTM